MIGLLMLVGEVVRASVLPSGRPDPKAESFRRNVSGSPDRRSPRGGAWFAPGGAAQATGEGR
jgi:hypothetical protein